MDLRAELKSEQASVLDLDLSAFDKLGVVDDDAVDVDDDDPELLAELAALTGAAPAPAKDPAALRAEALALKRQALALKRAGDAAGAVALLRRAKALEAGTAAVAGAAAAAAKGTSRDEGWRRLVAAVDAALKACVAEARAKIAAKDRAGAEALAARCRELKALAARAARSRAAGGAPPAWRATTATSRRRVVDGDVGEAALRVGVRSLRLPLAARARDGQAPRGAPKYARVAWALSDGCGATGAGRTELARLALASDGRSLVCDFVDCLAADCTLDGALVAAATASRGGAASVKQAHALSRFGRGKLCLDVTTAPGGAFFGKRESVHARAKVGLDGLLSAAAVDDAHASAGRVRSEDDASPVFARHGARVAFGLSLREPLREPAYETVAGRPDLEVDEATWPRDPGGALRAAPPAANVPQNELDDPRGVALLVSDAVLDAEIAKHDASSGALEVVALRLALVAAQQLLHAEVGNGSLTPRAYAARVKDRADADRRLAGHLRRLGRTRDAAAVAARVKIADAELAEMAEGGL